jgi:cytochrome bd-type quinol oxidase subunit 2
MIDKYPELKDRIQSSFIDTILIVIMMFVFAAVLDKYEDVPDWVRITMFAGLFIVYEPLCMTIGCTLGNFIKGIRVRKNTDTSKRINIFQAIIRYPVKVALGWLSFLTIGADSKRRAIHNMVAGSVMIKL